MTDKEKIAILQDTMERIFDLGLKCHLMTKESLAHLVGMEAYDANTKTGRCTRGFHFDGTGYKSK